MIFTGKLSYSEFLQSNEKIATNILADRLHTLEAQQLVEKVVARDKKSRYTYLLTETGIDLIPVILELAIGGSSNFPPGAKPDLIIEFEAYRKKTIKKYKALARTRIEQQRKAQSTAL